MLIARANPRARVRIMIPGPVKERAKAVVRAMLLMPTLAKGRAANRVGKRARAAEAEMRFSIAIVKKKIKATAICAKSSPGITQAHAKTVTSPL